MEPVSFWWDLQIARQKSIWDVWSSGSNFLHQRKSIPQEYWLRDVLGYELVVLRLKFFVDGLIVNILGLLQLGLSFYALNPVHIPELWPFDNWPNWDTALLKEPVVIVTVFVLVEELFELVLNLNIVVLLGLFLVCLLSFLEAHGQGVWLLADSINYDGLHLPLLPFLKTS